MPGMLKSCHPGNKVLVGMVVKTTRTYGGGGEGGGGRIWSKGLATKAPTNTNNLLDVSETPFLLSPYEPMLDSTSMFRSVGTTRLKFERWRHGTVSYLQAYRENRTANVDKECTEALSETLRLVSAGRVASIKDVATNNITTMFRASDKKFPPPLQIIGPGKRVQMMYCTIPSGGEPSSPNMTFIQATYAFNLDKPISTIMKAVRNVTPLPCWRLALDPNTNAWYYHNGKTSKWKLEHIEESVGINVKSPYRFNLESPAANADGTHPVYAVFEVPLHRKDIPWRLHVIGT